MQDEPKKDGEPAEVEEPKKEEPKAEDEGEPSKDTDTIDYDAEIEEEKKKGRPDPEIAKKAFLEREAKRKAEGKEEESEEDKPLTRKDIEEIESRLEKKHLNTPAFAIARSFAGSDKEAELIVEKWKNRTFPSTLPLSEQIEECYAITHRKKLIGERNEALRALKGQSGVNDNPAGTHHDEAKGGEPQMAGQDKAAIIASGFVFNGTTRRFEKKLKNGDILVRDSKTKQTYLIKKS